MLDSMEQFYPDVFKALQEKARTGNFIPATSGWVQMDENVIDGESLVRQFLYGQKFSKEKFGHYIRFAWQPDVFGHPDTMPQIAAKAGIEFYVFNRPHDPTRPPIIWWQGLDGIRVLGYTTPGEYTQPMDHRAHHGAGNAQRRPRRSEKHSGALRHRRSRRRAQSRGHCRHRQAECFADDVSVKPTNVADYIDLLLTEKKDFPVYDKELNPVFPGCYTTQVDMKRHNRQAEQLLLNAEKMSELAVFFGYRDYYPVRDFSERLEARVAEPGARSGGGLGHRPHLRRRGDAV